MTKKRLLVGLFVTLASLAGVGWWRQEPFLAWWRVKQLVQADDANRAGCVDRVVAAGRRRRAAPAARSGDRRRRRVCQRGRGRRRPYGKTWKTSDACATLLEGLRDEFDGFSTDNKVTLLRPRPLLAPEEEGAPVGAADSGRRRSHHDCGGDGSGPASGPASGRRPAGSSAAGTVARHLSPACPGGLTRSNPQIRAALHLTMREALAHRAGRCWHRRRRS